MSSKYGGYTGKILKVDLGKKSFEEYPFTDKERELFLGGKIMAAKIIYDNIKAKIEPLSEDNMMVVTTCPLTGTGVPSSSRFNISSISPLTGLLCSSNCGGSFGFNLKRAGYDGLIIVGKAKEKTYLKVTDKKIEFSPADEIWGKTTGETQKALGGRGGKIVIGPAGENLVRYACIVSEERAAGRGGLGAVMGSKNLKAVVAEGTYTPQAFNK
ncbi:MAG: aldehyde ferredoxin oxidoreductase N-terminal domain-containing protein, partial [Bacillota bacterium]